MGLIYAPDAAIVVTAWDALAADDWASSANFDNTSTLYNDLLVGGEIAATLGTLAAGEQFEIYVAARYDKDLATSYGGGLGTALGAGDSTLTEDVEFTPLNLKLLTVVAIEDTTPNTTQDYMWGPESVAALFGGTMPQHFILMIHNATGSATGTGNIVNAVGVTF